MTEHEAMAGYRRRVKSPVMHGAFRKGFRAAARGAKVAENPYRLHRGATGWGRRCYEAWVDGWIKAKGAL